MLNNSWIIGLLLSLVYSGGASARTTSLSSFSCVISLSPDTTKQSAHLANNSQEQQEAKGRKTDVLNKAKETVVKTVPKARNQQIPRPVVPKINTVAPQVKVKAKVNTKIKIKL